MVKSIKKVVEELASQLGQIYEPTEAQNIVRLLLEDKYHVDHSAFLADEEVNLDGESLQVDISRLLTNEPIQYVTETVYFYDRKFAIKKGALIPRPETEELVHLIVKNSALERPKILDVGSGSGCIAISLERDLNGETFGIDCSEGALEIARQNARVLTSEVTFLHHDILKDKPAIDRLDILVSNPPYIPNNEKKLMHKNVLDFEPEEALFVPDSSPLIFYERISELGLELLNEGGKLYFEIHENFGDEVKAMVQNIGFQDVLIHQDMQGKNRMLSATNSTSK